MRNRRAVLGLLLAGMLPALDCSAQQPAPVSAGILESVRPDSRLEIFYLGTPDCPYCHHWEAKARSDLIAWSAARGIYYVEIFLPILRQVAERRANPS